MYMSKRVEKALPFLFDSIMSDCHSDFYEQKSIQTQQEFIQKKKKEMKKVLEENEINFPLEEFFDVWESLEFKKSKFMYILGLQDGITFLGELEKAKETE